MAEPFPIKLINLDDSWDFQNELLTSGLDLFAEAHGVEIADFAGKGEIARNAQLLSHLEPWARIRAPEELGPYMARIGRDLRKLDSHAPRYGVVFCLDWSAFETYTSELPNYTPLRIAQDSAQTVPPWRSVRGQDGATSEQGGNLTAAGGGRLYDLVTALKSKFWPVNDDGKEIWISFFVFCEDEVVDEDLPHRWLRQFEANGIREHSTIFLAHSERSTSIKFTYLRCLLDLMRDVPSGEDSSAHKQAWNEFRNPVSGRMVQPYHVYRMSRLKPVWSYSDSLRQAIFDFVQTDDDDRLNEHDTSEHVSHTSSAVRKTLDESYVKFEVPDARATTDGSEIEKLIQSTGRIDQRHDPAGWAERLALAFSRYVVSRFKPLGEVLKELERDSVENSKEISRLQFYPGATRQWKEDARDTLKTVAEQAERCQSDARAHLAKASRLTIDEGRLQKEPEKATNITRLEKWKNLDDCLEALDTWHKRKIGLMLPLGVFVLGLVAMGLYVFSGIYFPAQADPQVKAIVDSQGIAFTRGMFLLALFNQGPFAGVLFDVWRGALFFSGVLLAFYLVTWTLAWVQVRRKYSQAFNAVRVKVRSIKKDLDQVVKEIVAYRAKALGAGQFHMLLNALRRAEGSRYSQASFTGLIGTRPGELRSDSDKTSDPLVLSFARHFFRGSEGAYNSLRLAEALSHSVEEAIAEDADESLQGQIQRDATERPWRAHFTAEAINLKIDEIAIDTETEYS